MTVATRQLSEQERAFIARMPKAELHIHIEGSVRPETLLDLGRRQGIAFPFADPAGARAWFTFRDFPHFIEVFVATKNALKTPDDYARITRELAEDAARQRIRYLELTFSPALLGATGPHASGEVILAGLREGARDALRLHDVRLQFICDPVRGRPVEAVEDLARWCGIEVGNPPEPYRGAFEIARRGGARVTIHAGETDGPASVWSALGVGTERIAHGVRAIEDPRLVRELADRGVVLEVAPTSNLRLGVYPDYAAHPYRALHEAGCQLTINSDDPPMFGTTLTDEYLALAAHQGFTVDDLAAASLRAMGAAFLPPAEREALIQAAARELADLRAEIFGQAAPCGVADPSPAGEG